jgi:hypothetical protein
MSNSWCKVENGNIVDGPRAWPDAIPPDDSWLPHRLVDVEHTVNDNFLGSVMSISGNEVLETKQYSPKSAEQIADEVNSIIARATENVAEADEKLADDNVTNKEEWRAYRNAWEQVKSVTRLGEELPMPPEPRTPFI